MEKTMEAQLYKDVFKGKCESVEGMCKNNPRILEGITPQHNSALHVAASRGHLEMVKLLIRLKPSILLMKNNKDETPLHTAAAAGKLEVVVFLLSINYQLQRNSGAHEELDVEASGSAPVCDIDESFWKSVNKDSETALHYAARGGHVEVVETLLERVKGIETAVNKDDESALYTACDHGVHEVSKKLLKKRVSADNFYIRNDGRTCLHIAITTEEEGLALELLSARSGLAEKADASGNMPLHLATLHGCLHVVRELLKIAPQSSFCFNKEKMYPIHIAAQVGCLQTVKLLIESAPHCIELPGKQNKNALHFAMENGKNWEVIRYLLQNAPDIALLVNEPDNEGNTGLHMALKFANVEVLGIMLHISTWNKNAVKRRIYGAIFKELGERKKRERYSVSENEIKTSGNEVRIVNREGDDLKNDSAQTLSIIATLLATVTFAALFTVPGGVSSEQGIPVHMHAAALRAFIIADTLAMCFSMLALMVLLDVHYIYVALVEVNAILFGFLPIGNSAKNFLQKRGFFFGRALVSFAFGATMVSYATGLYVLVAPRCLWLAVLACVTIFAVIFMWVVFFIRSVFKLLWTRMMIMSCLVVYLAIPTHFREEW